MIRYLTYKAVPHERFFRLLSHLPINSPCFVDLGPLIAPPCVCIHPSISIVDLLTYSTYVRTYESRAIILLNLPAFYSLFPHLWLDGWIRLAILMTDFFQSVQDAARHPCKGLKSTSLLLYGSHGSYWFVLSFFLSFYVCMLRTSEVTLEKHSCPPREDVPTPDGATSSEALTGFRCE